MTHRASCRRDASEAQESQPGERFRPLPPGLGVANMAPAPCTGSPTSLHTADGGEETPHTSLRLYLDPRPSSPLLARSSQSFMVAGPAEVAVGAKALALSLHVGCVAHHRARPPGVMQLLGRISFLFHYFFIFHLIVFIIIIIIPSTYF